MMKEGSSLDINSGVIGLKNLLTKKMVLTFQLEIYFFNTCSFKILKSDNYRIFKYKKLLKNLPFVTLKSVFNLYVNDKHIICAKKIMKKK